VPRADGEPVVRRGERFAAVMNGAITDARALWPRLLPNVAAREVLPNDAWLPLLAIAAGEAGVLRTLRGHHAYAVVDAATDRLWLGQDRYGEKPMWCVFERAQQQRRLVAFASTLPALRAFGIDIALPPRRLSELFRFGWAPLRPLRAGGLAISPLPTRGEPFAFDADGCLESRSPALPGACQAPPPPLRAALIASVGRCIDTAVPIGLSLSGGIDSSCLAFALGALGQTAPAYQLRAKGAANDERQAAAATAAQAGLALRPVDVGTEVTAFLPALTAAVGMPLGDPSVLAVHAVARAAAADGVRVLLGGEGADELLLGYRRYRVIARLPALAFLRALQPRLTMSYAARWLRAATAADPVTALLAVTPPAFADLVLAPALAARGVWRDRSLWQPSRERQPEPSDSVLRARAFEVEHYLRCDLLPKVDAATMLAGVEARCPFLDRDVAAAGTTRSALGKAPLLAAFPELPDAVRRLPKRGFALPLDRWFRGELPWLDLLAEPTTQQRPHLRPGGVARAVDLHRRGKVDLGHGLYLLVAVETFLRLRNGISRGTPTETPARA
jgi:asparagine synthase (glutamine-hydrolysing)